MVPRLPPGQLRRAKKEIEQSMLPRRSYKDRLERCNCLATQMEILPRGLSQVHVVVRMRLSMIYGLSAEDKLSEVLQCYFWITCCSGRHNFFFQTTVSNYKEQSSLTTQIIPHDERQTTHPTSRRSLPCGCWTGHGSHREPEEQSRRIRKHR